MENIARYLEKFSSVLSPEILEYLKIREKSGYTIRTLIFKLLALDRFCNERQLKEKIFTREDAEAYRLLRNHEALSTRYNRVCAAKLFFEWLLLRGYQVIPPRNVSNQKQIYFIPHIYTEEERIAYFNAVDSYEYGQAGRCAIIMPLLFRLLACNGLRLGEALSIRKCDVDLDTGIIKLSKTKNGAERYCILNDDLLSLMRSYASKTFYQIKDHDAIFWGLKALNNSVSQGTIHSYHVEFLHRAGIPYNGEHKGPRVHDWRWTAAVMSCKQLIDSGKDMHNSLIYLAQWLGHSDVSSCEYYLRYATMLFPYLCSKLDDTLEKALKSLGDSLEVPEYVD